MHTYMCICIYAYICIYTGTGNLAAADRGNATTRPHATHGAFGFQSYELTRGQGKPKC